jgi:hypothetical protein
VGGSAAKAIAQDPSSQPQQDEAQANTRPGDRDLDDEKLNLSADQKNQIKQIRAAAKSQAQAVRNDTSLTPEQRREKFRQIHRDANTKIHGVLTPEQRKIWHERKRDRYKHRRGRRQS